MKTTRGIYLDLAETEYSYKVGNLRFFFSSEFYRDKFLEEIEEFLKLEKFKFQNNYKLKLDDSEVFSFKLYSKIEKRGFYVYDILNKVYYKEAPLVKIKYY